MTTATGPSVTIQPAQAAVALTALAALDKAGGVVTANGEHASAARALAALMPPKEAACVNHSPGFYLTPLIDFGLVDADQLHRQAYTRLALRTDHVERLDELEAIAARAKPIMVKPRTLAQRRAATDGPPKKLTPNRKLTEPEKRAARVRKLIAETLMKHGPVEDRQSGRAVGMLAALLPETFSHELVSAQVTKMAEGGWLVVERNLRRTHFIGLGKLPVELQAPVAQNGHEKAPEAAVSAEPAQVAHTAPEAPAAPTAPAEVIPRSPLPPVPDAPTAPDDIQLAPADAADVAFALLDLVLKKAQQQPQAPDHRVAVLDGELSDARRRLAQAQEFGQAQRRQLVELQGRLDVAGDELRATKAERNMLRTRLVDVEANLKQVLRQSGSQTTAAYREGVQHTLNGIMRELPKAHT